MDILNGLSEPIKRPFRALKIGLLTPKIMGQPEFIFVETKKRVAVTENYIVIVRSVDDSHFCSHFKLLHTSVIWMTRSPANCLTVELQSVLSCVNNITVTYVIFYFYTTFIE